MVQVSLRAANTQDLPDILTVNRQSIPGVTQLCSRDLVAILATAPYFRVATVASQVVGYVIGYLAGSPYGGEEFAWFQRRYQTFLYVDQVAVVGHLRGTGIGAQLYQDVEGWARTRSVPLLTCEVHLSPPNPGSVRFHTRHGYHPVQELDTTDGRTVILMVKRL